MSERVALEEIYEETKGIYWYKKWNWCSDLSYSKWDGIKVDLAGHVVELDLRYNNLVGSLDELKEIHRLRYLKTLILSTNTLSRGLAPKFCQLECIEMLDLSWNQLSGSFPECIYSLRTLRVLKLDNNRFTGEVNNQLGNLMELRHLDLSCNQFSGTVPDVGYRLEHLKILNFEGNLFVGYIPSVAKDYIEMHSKFLC